MMELTRSSETSVLTRANGVTFHKTHYSSGNDIHVYKEIEVNAIYSKYKLFFFAYFNSSAMNYNSTVKVSLRNAMAPRYNT
jgi:hypothetical protein